MDVLIQSGSLSLPGILTVPPHAVGLIVFAHGSGSSRLSPRNQQVSALLNSAGLATLLFDLLTEQESADRNKVFDIPLLSRRLSLATRWAERQPELSHLPIGYFGASTGAAAALWSADELGTLIRAVVSRGGRPDLALHRLKHVTAPTLLIVGGEDEAVIECNQRAHALLTESKLLIVPGATHLFEEPGTLDQVAVNAAEWFLLRLPKTATKISA